MRNAKTIEEKWNEICHPIPTYELSDQIGLDTETAYILDLTREENFNIANDYLRSKVLFGFVSIDRRFTGDKVIMEMDTNGGDDGIWYMIHGNIDEYFESARKELERYIADMN